MPAVLGWALLCSLSCCTLLPGQQITAESDPQVDFAATLTAESITQQKEQVESATTDEALKTRLTEIYQQAIDHLTRIETLEKQLGSFQQAKDTAEQRAADFQAELDRPREPQVVDGTLPLAELEQKLVAAEAEQQRLTQSLEALNQQIASRTARRIEIRDRLLELEKQKNNIDPPSVAATNEPPSLTEARRIELLARNRRVQTEANTLNAELAAIDAEEVVDLPRIQRDLLTQQSTVVGRMVEALQVAVAQKRREDAQAQVESTAGQAEEESHPTLRTLAERNETLAKQYQTLTQRIEEVQADATSANEELQRITAAAKSAEQKVNAIGLTDAIGKMLRKQKRSLPGKRRFLSEIRERNESISSAQLELLELEEERARDVDQTLRRIRQDGLIPPDDVYRQAEEAVAKRNELLTPLIRAQSQYFDSLVEHSNTQEQIVQEIEDFEGFIDERVLWVRSSLPLFTSIDFERAEFRLLSPTRWQDAGQRLFTDFSMHWIWYVAAAILMIALLRNRFSFRRRIQSFGAAAAKTTCISYWPTAATLGLTVLAATSWPVLVGFLSWRCTVAAGDNDVLRALGHGLLCAAIGYLPLDLLRLACKPHGLAQAHFGWPNQVVDPLRGALRAFTLIGLPLVLLATMMSVGSERLGKETLERIPFIAVTVALAYFLRRLLRSDHGLFRPYMLRHPHGWFARLYPAWYAVAVFAPWVLAGLSLFGFHYTAQQLAWRLFLTACSLVAILVTYALASRWLWIQRRRLSLEQARKRREAQQQASVEGEQVSEPLELPSAEELRDQVKQSRSLLRTMMFGVALLAIWFSWIDVLPALGFLERHPLWNSSVQVTELVETETGEAQFITRDVVDHITISDVIFAMFFFGLMVVAAQNIPGVLEISLLQRLPIEAAVRYAITTIVRYAIILVGVFVSCSAVGIHWNQIQWMATALTFGLAFGLQEMFANFVAGIIILFERPIRVGDIVTVDSVTGKVSKVQIRATTITNWDCKDYIVPNKDFITGRVLNWTLSDKVNRIVVNVGLAYGSDKQLAMETLQRIATEHPLIEDEPAPSVTFEGFGDSTLDFVLRCYIAMQNMGSRLSVVHDLHTQIDDAFRQANIEIAFPQQDIHVRSMPTQNEATTDA